MFASWRALAEAAYPKEACALLIGRIEGNTARLTRLIPAANIDPHPRQGFELDPRVLIQTLRALRESGAAEILIGHVHSHPDAPAEPSARDLALAHEAGLIWVILPVTEMGGDAPTAWRADQDSIGQPVLVPIAVAL